METFVLFGERPFNDYAYTRLTNIANNIYSMSDVETLMYKDSFEDLVKKLVAFYSLQPVNISFEDKLVDLIDKPENKGSHYFAEYTLMVTGDSGLLHLDPYNNGYVQLPVPVLVKTNVISFEIDTHFSSEDLPEAIIKNIKEDYIVVKDFIATTILYLNNESQKFNLRLEEFIIPLLAKKMRSASMHMDVKKKLNF